MMTTTADIPTDILTYLPTHPEFGIMYYVKYFPNSNARFVRLIFLPTYSPKIWYYVSFSIFQKFKGLTNGRFYA